VRQERVVAEFQEEVEHKSADNFADAVKSIPPKFRPVTVTDEPPLCGVFIGP
jgi:hypothetical protein